MIRRFAPPPCVQLAGLIAVMGLAGSVRAAEPATDPKLEETARIVRLLDKIEQRMSQMDAKLDTVVDMGRELKQLREDMTRVQRDVADLRRSGAGNSSSYYPGQTNPPPSISPAVPAPMSRVRLVNSYFSDMTATVNGLTYVVPAGTAREVTVPIGQLTYQVYQTGQPMRVTTINPSEMVTVTMFPA